MSASPEDLAAALADVRGFVTGRQPEGGYSQSPPEALEVLEAALAAQPRRRALTQAALVDRLLSIIGRSQGEHSSIELWTTAKGEVQKRVAVRTGEAGIETAEQAADEAARIFDSLRARYPDAAGNGEGAS